MADKDQWVQIADRIWVNNLGEVRFGEPSDGNNKLALWLRKLMGETYYKKKKL